MASSKSFLFTLLSLTLILNTSAAAQGGPDDDNFWQWKPIPNVTDPTIVDIAEFALAEYNKQPKKLGEVVYDKVVKGKFHDTGHFGFNIYLLDINATSETPSASGEYLAKVSDKPSTHFRKLVFVTKIVHH